MNRESAKVTVATEQVADVAVVRARLAALLGEHDGWVQFAGACVPSYRGQPCVVPTGAGYPLAAEFCTGDRSSVSLRQDGAGWAWTTFAEGEGEPVQVVRSEQLSTEGERRLVHRVFWRADAQQAPVEPWRPWVARFTGWSHAQAGEG